MEAVLLELDLIKREIRFFSSKLITVLVRESETKLEPSYLQPTVTWPVSQIRNQLSSVIDERFHLSHGNIPKHTS